MPNKEQLQLKEISPYLPYGVRIKTERSNIREIKSLHSTAIMTKSYQRVIAFKNIKLILRPLSDLTKEIEHNGEKLVPIKELLRSSFFNVDSMDNEDIFRYEEALILDISLSHAELLYSWHFDLKCLIDRGLAINYNEVNK